MAEHTTASEHSVRVFTLFESHPSRWFTSAEVAAQAKVCARTARAHTLTLVEAGLVELAPLFPGYRYRLRAKADKKSDAYRQRLKAAQEAFGQ